MGTFSIKEDFYLNGEKIKLLSGAIHYFRIQPEQWQESLYNLKALGFNTVETYIPWNLHEPVEGQFDFEGIKDIERFIQLAQKEGLYVILRPSAYICAEWEFGGLPAWLLKEKKIKLRSTDSVFMEKVENYFRVLLPKLTPYQITNDGPVLMMQIENEYGSYGNEKAYLRATKALMEKLGVDVPLFTADGSWEEALDAGSLIEDDVFVTGNFGSKSQENSIIMKNYFQRHGKNWPIMCMEYWDGWFNRWGEKIIRRDAEELASEIREMIKIGSLNLYMFHGGTNFGFMNGCSARGATDLPQITSYDYDGLLTEWGAPTEKYFAIQKVVKELLPDTMQVEPIIPQTRSFGTFKVNDQVNLLETIEEIGQTISSDYPLTAEEIGTGYGYVLYQTRLKNYHREQKIKVIDASDRVHLMIDGEKKAIQYREEIGEELMIVGSNEKKDLKLDLLVENLGRVNYGFKLNSPTQSKGLKGGLMTDIHFHSGWKNVALDFTPEMLAKINYQKSYEEEKKAPAFHRFYVKLSECEHTFIDCSNYGKGVIFLNGVNLGRYWEKGPIASLFVPKSLLKKENEFVVFETEGKPIETLALVEQPVYK